MNLKNILITLSIVAVVLMAITFYVVFYGSTGTYVVSSTTGPNAAIFSTSTVIAPAHSPSRRERPAPLPHPALQSPPALPPPQLNATPITVDSRQ